jgi:hypothetical protein
MVKKILMGKKLFNGKKNSAFSMSFSVPSTEHHQESKSKPHVFSL